MKTWKTIKQLIGPRKRGVAKDSRIGRKNCNKQAMTISVARQVSVNWRLFKIISLTTDIFRKSYLFFDSIKNWLDPEYAHMALLRSDGSASLLEIDAIRAMCNLEFKLTTIRSYKGFCQQKFHVKECCRPWSIPNYIVLLTNKTACHEIEVKWKFNHNLLFRIM